MFSMFLVKACRQSVLVNLLGNNNQITAKVQLQVDAWLAWLVFACAAVQKVRFLPRVRNYDGRLMVWVRNLRLPILSRG